MSGPLFGTSLVGGGYGILPIPLGGGSGGGGGTDIAEIVDGWLHILTGPGVSHLYSRSITLDNQHGCIVEIKLRIPGYKPRFRSGYFVVIDDAVNAYGLSFVDTEIGKFVCVTVRSGNQMIEKAGTEGLASKVSALCDWTQPHIYRLERRPQDGLYLFIDNNTVPTIALLDEDRIDYPISQFSAPTVAFGHFDTLGTESYTKFVRVAVSEGYEVSTKKNASEAELEQDLRKSQAIVLVMAQDTDP